MLLSVTRVPGADASVDMSPKAILVSFPNVPEA